VPELIFGHLLTSSNYDDSEKKVTGGHNGYSAKLAKSLVQNSLWKRLILQSARNTTKYSGKIKDYLSF
jgi:DNA gyrase/topoisomerase IV subunit B